MKKLAYFAAALLTLAACSKNPQTAQVETPLDQARDSLQIALANQDSLLILMTEIQQGLNDIKNLENIMASGDLGSETSNKREQIRHDMMAIQTTLAEKRQRLADLETRLKKANNNNANLQKAIAALRSQITDQETTIETLRKDLAAANIHIDALNTTVDTLKKSLTISNQEREKVERKNEDLTNELNTCYYAIGSKKELKEHKLIETGFLRKTKIMPEDFEQSYFTRADKRTLDVLPLNSKKAKILTNQPAQSYEITTGDNGLKTLVITNPTAFWSTSNYVVIQVD